MRRILNNAVYLVEDFLKATTNPPYARMLKTAPAGADLTSWRY